MPYPGTPLWPDALQRGYVPPNDQAGWAQFDLNRGNTPWIDESQARAMTDISNILYVGRSQGHWSLSPYYSLLRWRWLNQQFDYYWEGRLKQTGTTIVDRVGPLRVLRDRYGHKFVRYNANTHKNRIETHMPAG